jgi:transposase-like protein
MKKVEQSEFEKKVLDQFLSGKNLFGEDGALAPLLKNVLDKALQAEMENHLDESERSSGNKRNGKKTKTVKSSLGNFELETPQDRQSSFEPEIVKKRQTILADQLADKIIGLYGLGMSYRDICTHIKEIYDTEISHTVLSQITDRIIPDIKQWQNRPLESMYCIVWLDAMHYKVKVDGRMESKALYNILGVNRFK